MMIVASLMMPKGRHALLRDGQVIWVGPVGSPIEDVDCDTIIFSPEDYERVKAEREWRKALNARPPATISPPYWGGLVKV